METVPEHAARPGAATKYDISLPGRNGHELDQDEEWCLLDHDGEVRRVRFHDYHEIYALPGFYEQLFYEELQCNSPRRVIDLLQREMRAEEADPSELSVLDVGAGNGMVAEQLAQIGAGKLVGVDIIEEAATAAERDRPGLYDDYLVADLTALTPEQRRTLESHELNALTCVAALGFGDIPPAAFATAYDLLPAGSWLAFSIKEDFLHGDADGAAPSGFSRLIKGLSDRGMLDLRVQERHLHRRSVSGEPLHYMGIVAVKRSADPARGLAEAA